MTKQPYILALVSFAVFAVLIAVPLVTGQYLRWRRERAEGEE